MKHYIYLLKCKDKSLYCGYTTNLEKRLRAHNNSKTGAKYTKTRRPVALVYSEAFDTKSLALKREFEIKQLSRAKKFLLFK